MKYTLTKVQKKLLDLMAQGHRLWCFPTGYELSGRPFWPRQRRTVRKLLDLGLIVYDGKENKIQRECGMKSIGLAK